MPQRSGDEFEAEWQALADLVAGEELHALQSDAVGEHDPARRGLEDRLRWISGMIGSRSSNESCL